MKTNDIRAFFERYRDILLFAVCLFAANFLWKLMIQGDESTNEVVWLGRDVTLPFRTLSEHIARMVFGLTSLFTNTVHYREPSSIVFDSGFSYMVVWSCTAIKQSFIWLIIMLFARGNQRHKIWFTPFGWLVAYAFNIVRIAAIGLLCEHHPGMFEFYHVYLFKFLFYAIFFALWVWWVERIGFHASGRFPSE